MSAAGAPDFFYREAIRLGYVARSAFKLLQMQNKYKLITQGSAILDLGCAPGAWLQVACQSLGALKNGGSVVGIDLKKVKVPSTHCDSRVQTVCADVLNLPKQRIKALSPQEKGFKVVLSDMCPLVSGIASKDAALSTELGMRALGVAVGKAAMDHIVDSSSSSCDCSDNIDDGVLQMGGSIIIKILESEDVREFNRICKPLFRKTSWLRPKATRPSSREIYLICQGLQKT
ncbi:hypothetical protein SAY86_005431 [Trapa natans]|uniref:rRNA methyltransferase 2, mitochondrial n=1 Tax=Trapa natans TaxID=22666 RepID=A0AAN7KUT3_TRANT|nr:hypothetical protein SAY86_005431 [Trapa natans]